MEKTVHDSMIVQRYNMIQLNFAEMYQVRSTRIDQLNTLIIIHNYALSIKDVQFRFNYQQYFA